MREKLLVIDAAKFNYTGFTVYCRVLLDTILRDHLQSRSNLVHTNTHTTLIEARVYYLAT